MTSWIGSLGLLILRVGFGGMLAIGHGLPKMQNFQQFKDMADPMHFLAAPYAGMALVGAELVCAALVAVGLMTRLVSIPVAYAMGVAALVAHQAHPTFTGPEPGPSKELALLYMIVFTAIIFTGPGRFSLDALFFGRRRSVETTV